MSSSRDNNNQDTNPNNNESPSKTTSPPPPPPPIQAAAVAMSSSSTTTSTNDTSSDYRIAQELNVIQQLMTIFQFTYSQAENAVMNVGPDVTQAYNYILDQGGDDKGGAIVPKNNCPHLQKCLLNNSGDGDINMDRSSNNFGDFDFCFERNNVCTYFLDQEEGLYTGTANRISSGSKRKSEMVDGKCPKGENWICLSCKAVRFSRYVNGHCKDHWINTKNEEMENVGCLDSKLSYCDEGNNENEGLKASGHCVALSLQDLSVWCYECNAYLVHKDLDEIVRQFESMKFSEGEGLNSNQTNHDKEQDMNRKSDDNNDPDEYEEDDDANQDLDQQYSPTGKEHKMKIPSSDSSESNSELDSESESDSHSSSDSLKEENVEYFIKKKYSLNTPHPYLPKSLRDLANYIKSDECQSIVILAGAGMSRASGSK